jgi:hypothetical protein
MREKVGGARTPLRAGFRQLSGKLRPVNIAAAASNKHSLVVPRPAKGRFMGSVSAGRVTGIFTGAGSTGSKEIELLGHGELILVFPGGNRRMPRKR